MARIKSIPVQKLFGRGTTYSYARRTVHKTNPAFAAIRKRNRKLARQYGFSTFPGHPQSRRLYGGIRGYKRLTARMYTAPARGFIQRRRFRNDRPMMRKRKLNRSGYSGRRGFGR